MATEQLVDIGEKSEIHSSQPLGYPLWSADVQVCLVGHARICLAPETPAAARCVLDHSSMSS